MAQLTSTVLLELIEVAHGEFMRRSLQLNDDQLVVHNPTDEVRSLLFEPLLTLRQLLPNNGAELPIRVINQYRSSTIHMACARALTPRGLGSHGLRT